MFGVVWPYKQVEHFKVESLQGTRCGPSDSWWRCLTITTAQNHLQCAYGCVNPTALFSSFVIKRAARLRDWQTLVVGAMLFP